MTDKMGVDDIQTKNTKHEGNKRWAALWCARDDMPTLRPNLPEEYAIPFRAQKSAPEPEPQPVFTFNHAEHGAFCGTAQELRAEYNLHASSLARLVKGGISACGGWTCAGESVQD